jgi:hypothetical protein
MKQFKSLFVAAAVIASTLVASEAPAYDLTDPKVSNDAFVRMRADTSGKDAYADWHTTVFIVEPGKRAVPVMRLDGFNVGRAIRRDDGSYQWLSREVAYYRDLKTGAIIDKWQNPVTGQMNDVLQVINDPVNSVFTPARAMPWRVKGDDVFLTFDVPLAYPNALQPADYPEESSGPMYFATESFMFFAKMADFKNEKLTSVPSTYSWARTGPWLPWMKMGQRPGYVLYTGQGKKLGSAAELDPVVREYTEKNHPDFMKAPATLVTPNETSWTYYRKVRGGGKGAPPAGGGKEAPKDAPKDAKAATK